MPAHDSEIWITKDKHKIRVLDIEDRHLINIVNYLRRKAKQYIEKSIVTEFDFSKEQLLTGQKELDEFLCFKNNSKFRFVLLEGKIRGIIDTPMTFSEILNYIEVHKENG